MWHHVGKEEGIEQGLEQGTLLGKEEGRILEAQNLLSRLLRGKFGDLPPETVSYLEGLRDREALEQLALQVLTANALEEMNFAK
jgi:hypothetical protein